MSSNYNNGNKKYYPTKRNNIPARKNNTPAKYSNTNNLNPNGFFGGNLARDMKFGSEGDSLSGYVTREIIIKDRQGNTKIAREKQFFNSGKEVNVRINKNDKY